MLTRRLPEPLATIVGTVVLVAVVVGLLEALSVNLGPIEFVIVVLIVAVAAYVVVRAILASVRSRQAR